MTIQAHLAQLERRHHELEMEISEALKHNSIDDLKIVELKRQKLHLKDAIERLQQLFLWRLVRVPASRGNREGPHHRRRPGTAGRGPPCRSGAEADDSDFAFDRNSQGSFGNAT